MLSLYFPELEQLEQEVKCYPFESESFDQTELTTQSIPSNPIGPEIMWNKGFTGKGVLVGVIDTGISTHKDLKNVVIKRVYTNEIGEPKNLHGSHVAGIIGANSAIVKGVAYEASLADYRVLTNSGSGSMDNIVKAVRDAVRDGCDVINMSLGGSINYPPLRAAIQDAYVRGVVVVVAAGNEGDGINFTREFSYPAMYPSVISVGSCNYNGVNTIPSRFSNSNYEVDCSSQGENVISCSVNNGYARLSGTSMAAPHIAGVVALLIQEIKSQNRVVKSAEVFNKIKSLCKDIYLRGKDFSTGWGFVTFRNSI